MALQVNSPSMHNRLLGKKIPHPPSTKFDDEDFPSPSPKRLKRMFDSPSKKTPERQGSKARPSPHHARTEIPDSDDDEDNEMGGVELPPNATTQLETALPTVQTDQGAIEAYEAFKAGEEELTLQERLDKRTWTRGRSSIYVDAFNLALETVLEEEGNLFDNAETSLFEQWKALSYEAQYLYVRLFLRKTSVWHRISKLGYYDDIADMGAAVLELQKERTLPKVDEEVLQTPGELNPPEGTTLPGNSFTFAECSSEHITTLDEASSLLLLDELKVLAKEVKVVGKTKRELLHNLRRTSGKQGGLGFRRSDTTESTSSVKSEDASLYEDEETDGTITPTHLNNRDAHFTKKILDQTGRCIRLSLPPLKLFERVHLVFYRSTEWSEKSLTTLILAKISRRNFPDYIVSRSATIFESRALLLEFEASLRTQFHVDNILEFNGTPGPKAYEEVKVVFEAVYPRWKSLVASEQLKEDRIYESGEGAYLRRFSPAWVYTRIVHKGLQPLARFKEHLREHEILSELLFQRLFHAARRGAWYQRKALLEEHYMYALRPQENRSEEANKKHWKRIALATCETALQDRDCHVIYHYDLQKRIRKIEKQLKIPKREQHEFSHVSLDKAIERSVEGIRIEREETPLRSLSRRNSGVEGRFESVRRAGGKTIWLDELDTNAHVSVESMCLSHYRKKLSYKGYHSEGGILRTLFGLLFYDVLFDIYVPNVFQTAYQTCPLDLHTDAFYGTRISEINARVNEIANGDAAAILRRTWDAHFQRRTCVVGVRWDGYELDDLVEIVDTFKGEALGTVMRVMAQEYQARGGGVPDLFLWRPAGYKAKNEVPNEGGAGGIGGDNDGVEEETGSDERGGADKGANDDNSEPLEPEILFAEVKSENDRLSDTQRLWISVLLNAGIKVELCHAVAREVRRE